MPQEFKLYRRTHHTEMRPFEDTPEDQDFVSLRVSVSDADADNGSPKVGDMIARNPANPDDLWLVSEAYFNKNFEAV